MASKTFCDECGEECAGRFFDSVLISDKLSHKYYVEFTIKHRQLEGVSHSELCNKCLRKLILVGFNKLTDQN